MYFNKKIGLQDHIISHILISRREFNIILNSTISHAQDSSPDKDF